MQNWMPIAAIALCLGGLTGCNSGSSDRPTPSPGAEQPADPIGEQPGAGSLKGIRLGFVGRYSSGVFNQSAAEIPVFDPLNRQIFVVNAQLGAIDVLDATDLGAPVKVRTLTVESIAPGAVVNSIAYHGGLIAVAIESSPKTDPGYVALYNATSLTLLDVKQVGAQPDMLTFTPDGRYLLVANEGEPSDDYQTDPEGSVSVIQVGIGALGSVRTAGFRQFNSQKQALIAQGVRIFGPNATVAQDLEPEYITVSADGRTAWIALQENNALARLDVERAEITSIVPLGYKDHGVPENGLDVSDTDGRIDIRAWPGLSGMYQPDSIASYQASDSRTYIVTANEGDARAWGETNAAYFAGDASLGFVEEFRVTHLVHRNGFNRRLGNDLPPQLHALGAGALLNPDVFGYCGATAGDPGNCSATDQLGRLTVTWTKGFRTHPDGSPVMFNTAGQEDPAGDRIMYDRLYVFGSRSVSIWDANGELVWDSGDQMERFLASEDCLAGAERDTPCSNWFNANHSARNSFDNRSDNKGPEPEGLVLGQLDGRTYAFVGLERMGGVMVYDITDPRAPKFVDYLNTREDWTSDPASNLASVGDLGPEGLYFVTASDSPNGKPLLIIGNEVSGTTSIYEIEALYEP